MTLYKEPEIITQAQINEELQHCQDSAKLDYEIIVRKHKTKMWTAIFGIFKSGIFSVFKLDKLGTIVTRLIIIIAIIAGIMFIAKYIRTSIANNAIKEQKAHVQVLADANKNLAESVQREIRTQQINDAVAQEAIEQKDKLRDEYLKLQQEYRQKEAELLRQFESKLAKLGSKTPSPRLDNQIAKVTVDNDIHLSQIRIDYLWQVYCKSSSNTQECKDYKGDTKI